MRFAKGLAALDCEEKASLIALWQAEKGLRAFFGGSSPDKVERCRQQLLDGGLIRVELEWRNLLQWASGCQGSIGRAGLEKALLITAAEALGLNYSGGMSDRSLESAIFERVVEMQCKQLERSYQEGVRQDPRFELELRSRLDQELTALSNLESRQVQKFVAAPQPIVDQVLMHLQGGRLFEILRDTPNMFGVDASLVLTHVARAITKMIGLRLPAGLCKGLTGFASPVFAFVVGLITVISEVIRSARQAQQERRYRWAVLLVSLGYLTALQRGEKSGWLGRFFLRCVRFFRSVWRSLLRAVA